MTKEHPKQSVYPKFIGSLLHSLPTRKKSLTPLPNMVSNGLRL